MRIAYALAAGIAVAMPIDDNAADGNSDKYFDQVFRARCTRPVPGVCDGGRAVRCCIPTRETLLFRISRCEILNNDVIIDVF